MAIVTANVSTVGQGTTGTQFIGPIVVSVQGLGRGSAALQRSPDNSVWYTTNVITDDVETNGYAPGNTLQDYYRIILLSNPDENTVKFRVGN